MVPPRLIRDVGKAASAVYTHGSALDQRGVDDGRRADSEKAGTLNCDRAVDNATVLLVTISPTPLVLMPASSEAVPIEPELTTVRDALPLIAYKLPLPLTVPELLMVLPLFTSMPILVPTTEAPD